MTLTCFSVNSLYDNWLAQFLIYRKKIPTFNIYAINIIQENFQYIKSYITYNALSKYFSNMR